MGLALEAAEARPRCPVGCRRGGVERLGLHCKDVGATTVVLLHVSHRSSAAPEARERGKEGESGGGDAPQRNPCTEESAHLCVPMSHNKVDFLVANSFKGLWLQNHRTVRLWPGPPTWKRHRWSESSHSNLNRGVSEGPVRHLRALSRPNTSVTYLFAATTRRDRRARVDVAGVALRPEIVSPAGFVDDSDCMAVCRNKKTSNWQRKTAKMVEKWRHHRPFTFVASQAILID